MKFFQALVIVSSAVRSVCAYGPWSGPGGGFGPSCLGNCWSSLSGVNWQSNGITALCGNATAVDTLNSCVAGSSCSNDDKQNTYKVLAQICATAGSTISATPEASYSATSGGSLYPTTTGSWASYASQWATVTATPSGWGPGSGYGPFGAGGNANGWGPWSGSSAWTNGPWTSWWGQSACPPSTWSGWTSASWASSAPWTTWTACSATTTATSVVISTVTSGSSTAVQTSTSYAVRVAEASNSGSSSTSSAAAAQVTAQRDLVGHGLALGAVALAMAAF